MKIFHKADGRISQVWGKGKPGGADYRLFTYLIIADVDDGRLMSNTVTGEMVLLDEAEKQKLLRLPCEYDSWMDELIERRFLVNAENDDAATVENLRSLLRVLNKSDKITSYTILPTTCCNARCFYCYENGITRENMSDETADAVIEYIDKHHGDGPVTLRWIGGEPLLGVRQIDRICAGVKARGIPFVSQMLTNGYSFTDESARRVKEDWNLSNVHIPLDGTEEVYNVTKSYVSPSENPYCRVIRNIHLLLEAGIDVDVRLNVGLHNVDNLQALVKELSDSFPNKEGLRAYTKLLYNDCGTTHFSENDLTVLLKGKAVLDDLIADEGFELVVTVPKLRVSRCMADSDDQSLILPSGKLGTCENLLTEHIVGNLDTGITDDCEVARCKEITRAPHCLSCSYYPSCIHLLVCPCDPVCTPGEAEAKQLELVTAFKNFYLVDHGRNRL